jgi:hypothetical protein
METLFAIGFLAGLFALGYWIGSMRANLKHLQANKPAVTPAPRKKVAK